MSAAQDLLLSTARRLRYKDVACEIERQIADGRLTPGSRLIGERDLSSALRVSRVTVRRALAELQAKGLVSLDDTRGWLVGQASVTERNVLHSFTEFANARGAQARARVLKLRTREANLAEMDLFDAAVGDPLFEIVRLRLMDDEPIAIETSRVPLSICPTLVDADFTAASLHALLHGAKAGPVRADYALTAASADPEEGALLGVAVGGPLLVSDAIARDARGRVVEASHSLFRADRYRFHTTLRGASGAG